MLGMWDVRQLILFLASLSCCHSLSNSPACSAECRQALAEALCAEVLVSLPTDEEEDAPVPLRAQLMLAEEFRPILQPRAAASSAGVEALEEGLQLLSRKRCSSSTIPVRKTPVLTGTHPNRRQCAQAYSLQ